MTFARAGLIAAVLAAVAFGVFHRAPKPLDTVTAAPVAASSRRPQHRAPDELVVYVAGAVRRPGLYRLRAGARAADAVGAAGGLLPQAQPGGVNLAAHAADGDEIYAPATGENASARRSSRRPAHPRTRARATAAPAGDLDVNDASARDLAAIPGIGRAIAARIVEMRERDGAFTTLDELLDVAGMTAARLERARPFLRPPRNGGNGDGTPAQGNASEFNTPRA